MEKPEQSRRSSILGFFSPDWKQRTKELGGQAAQGHILESPGIA